MSDSNNGYYGETYEEKFDENFKECNAENGEWGIILNNRVETSIVFNNLSQFLEKIYFGDLFENEWYLSYLEGREGDYYCAQDMGSQIQNLIKININFGWLYTLLITRFFIKKSEDKITWTRTTKKRIRKIIFQWIFGI